MPPSPPPPSPPSDGQPPYDSIALIGGGIAGLTLAISLLHRSIPFTLYESAPAFAEIGAGVSLGPNSARAMKMIDPRIYAGFQRCATNNAWAEKRQTWFTFRKGGRAEDCGGERGEVGEEILDLFSETGQTSVHRARFLEELVALVPESVVRFGKRCVDVVARGDGAGVVVRFADGEEARHSAAIGCDGIKSRVRHAVLGADHPAAKARFTGKYAYRGLIPMSSAASLLGDRLARNAQMYLGLGGHILTFPIEHGETMNVVAFATKADGKWEDDEWVKPLDREAMYRDFEGWVPAAKKILSLMQKPDCWALFEHPPADTYVNGRICVVGDAAHASTPHNGAGAGQAIEDALVMGRALALVRENGNIPRAFTAFDRVRRPRSQRQVREANKAGWLYDLQDPEIGADWDRLKERLAVKQKWIWEHDLEADVEEVERVYRGEVSSRL